MRPWGDWAIGAEDLAFVTDWWQEQYGHLLKDFGFPECPALPDDFLVKLWYHGGFFMDDKAPFQAEYEFVIGHFGVSALRLCDELDVPRVTRYVNMGVDSTTVHHLYHIARWERSTGLKMSSIPSIVEWGGGYGSFARLCLTMNPSMKYSIIDLPLTSCIASRYLDIAGYAGRVQFYAPSEIRDLEGDLFVSTWALDESTAHAQAEVAALGYFGAHHALIAFHPDKDIFPDSGGITGRFQGLGEQSPAGVPDSYYCFC